MGMSAQVAICKLIKLSFLDLKSGKALLFFRPRVKTIWMATATMTYKFYMQAGKIWCFPRLWVLTDWSDGQLNEALLIRYVPVVNFTLKKHAKTIFTLNSIRTAFKFCWRKNILIHISVRKLLSKTDRQADRQTYITDRQRDKNLDRQLDRRTSKQTDGLMDKQTRSDRQTDRQADR